MTFEKAEQHRAQLEQKILELELLQSTEPTTLWLRDLNAVDIALDDRDAALHAAEVDERKAQKKNKSRVAIKKKSTKQKKHEEWDSNTESDSNEGVMDVDSDSIAVAPKMVKPPVSRKPAVKKQAPATGGTQKHVAQFFPKKVVVPPPPPIQKQETFSIDDSSDDGMGESLMERMQKKMVVSPPPKSKPPTDNLKKRPSFEAEIKPKKVAKKPLLTQKSAESSNATKAVKASKPAQRKKIIDTDSEDDLDFPDDDEEDAEMQFRKAPPARARPARTVVAKKPTLYNMSSDDDDDDNSDAEFS